MQVNPKNCWILDNMLSQQNNIIKADSSLSYENGHVHMRPMSENDVIKIAEMEKQCFASPWSIAAILSELNAAHSKSFVITLYDKIIGYAVAWFIVDEFHLANIAIDKEYRKKGIGQWLVTELVTMAIQLNKKHAFLEVRRSNIPAIHLYQKLGFSIIDVRKNYYSTEKEDALIMGRLLS